MANVRKRLIRRARGLGAEHEERRREIADALLGIISEHGLEAVNLRDVASRAGVSPGRVQHYFRSKDQMLTFAFEHINKKGEELVGLRVAQSSASPRNVLRSIAIELLPIDSFHRDALRIGTAFTARAVAQAEIAEQLRSGYNRLRELFVLLLAQARENDELASHIDPEIEAHLLLAIFEGLSAQAMLENHTDTSALAIIDSYLDRIFIEASV